jgi:hypothetical protein
MASLSQNAFAKLGAGSPAVGFAGGACGPHCNRRRWLNRPSHPANIVWGEAARKRAALRTRPTNTPASSAYAARLRTLEYDCAVRRWFHVRRAPLAEWLHGRAALLVAELGAFPAPRYADFMAVGHPAESIPFFAKAHGDPHRRSGLPPRCGRGCARHSIGPLARFPKPASTDQRPRGGNRRRRMPKRGAGMRQR